METLETLNEKLQKIMADKQIVLSKQLFEEASILRDKEKMILDQIDKLKKQ
jgi:hypothetical protein